jgi:hypothetical protein
MTQSGVMDLVPFCRQERLVGAFGSVTFGGSNSSTVSALVDIGHRNGQGGGFWSDSTLLSIGIHIALRF